MGNAHAALLQDAEWDIQAIKQKKDWLNLSVDDFFSSDFLELNFRGNLVSQSLEAISRQSREADAVTTSGDAKLSRPSLLRLAQRLRASCHSDGPFTVQLLQRLHVLQWIHDAVVDKSVAVRTHSVQENQKPSPSAHVESKTSSPHAANQTSRIADRKSQRDPSQSLIVELLATMVVAIQDEDAGTRSDFIQAVSPLICDLVPLSLISAESTQSGEQRTAGQPESSKLLDRVREFLFLSSIQPYATKTKTKTHNGSVTASRDDVNSFMRTRQTSLKALVTLAMARGSLMDVLMAIKALLLASQPISVEVPVERDDTDEVLYSRLTSSLSPSIVTLLGNNGSRSNSETGLSVGVSKVKNIAIMQSKAGYLPTASREMVAVATGGVPGHGSLLLPSDDSIVEVQVQNTSYFGVDFGQPATVILDDHIPARPVSKGASTRTVQVALPSVAIVSELKHIADMDTPALMNISGGNVDGGVLAQSDACEVRVFIIRWFPRHEGCVGRVV
mgnify:CR=1 FL=1